MSPVLRLVRWYDALNYEEKAILREALGLMALAIVMILYARALGWHL